MLKLEVKQRRFFQCIRLFPTCVWCQLGQPTTPQPVSLWTLRWYYKPPTQSQQTKHSSQSLHTPHELRQLTIWIQLITLPYIYLWPDKSTLILNNLMEVDKPNHHWGATMVCQPLCTYRNILGHIVYFCWDKSPTLPILAYAWEFGNLTAQFLPVGRRWCRIC